MRAVVLERIGGPEELGVREVDDPRPGPGEVLVRVRAAGVCGRDLIDRRGGFPAMKLPAILGHEFAGDVLEVGAGVERVAVGDKVANLHRPWCGECRACLAGNAVDCERAWQSFGHTVDGAYAELCVAHERALVKVPPSISHVDAASVGCTAGVALRALRREARVELGETVLVTGASGGVGLMAIQIARRAGARVIAVTSSSEKVAAIERFGADHVIVAPDGQFEPQVKALGGADIALELVGSATFTSALKSLRRAGRLVLVGNITLDRVSVNPGALILFGLGILGSHGYSVRDLEDCFAMMQRGELTMAVDRTLPLDQAGDAHRLLADRKASGRIVLVPSPGT
jgi:NADPH:quinone reductase-like Zn-dependent oxidoreductase